MVYLSGNVRGDQPAVCRSPAITGLCKAAFRRYFYDSGSGKCRLFIYGGCGGNGNNFESLAECRAVCTCSQPRYSGGSGCVTRSRRQYFYNTDTGSCARLRYSGCAGNSNRFRTASQCRSACALAKCFLPKETGLCKAAFQRYYYDSDTGRCQKFVWGGCGGNSNNFRSKSTCQSQCASNVSPRPSVTVSATSSSPDTGKQNQGGGNLSPECFLPKIIGLCRAAFHRFYYNNKTGRCEGFIFGGCLSNANNFQTLSACESRCPSGSSESSKLSAPGRGNIPGRFSNGRVGGPTAATRLQLTAEEIIIVDRQALIGRFKAWPRHGHSSPIVAMLRGKQRADTLLNCVNKDTSPRPYALTAAVFMT
ncbi:hypothetical protein RRG08_052492 [Elysia crispata]|uniref:BPTI/Kunitz inhibitor domain-containing protein n=1 Tax=Elysia crispata TaxID=231223 RepID=A0AAE1CJY6_9GAST|nr:hypothetical protein RRG08_052492 [Elysia crispata]